MTTETHDSETEESPVTQTRPTLPNHKLTIALVGLAVGFIVLVALNMK
jgi:hypothetical protein